MNSKLLVVVFALVLLSFLIPQKINHKFIYKSPDEICVNLNLSLDDFIKLAELNENLINENYNIHKKIAELEKLGAEDRNLIKMFEEDFSQSDKIIVELIHQNIDLNRKIETLKWRLNVNQNQTQKDFMLQLFNVNLFNLNFDGFMPGFSLLEEECN